MEKYNALENMENTSKYVWSIHTDIGIISLAYNDSFDGTNLILHLNDVHGNDHILTETKITNNKIESSLHSVTSNESVCKMELPISLDTFYEDALRKTILDEKYSEDADFAIF